MRRISEIVLRELVKPNAYLLPLRLFIGIGWIRASLEKVIEPGWTDGAALREFLREQMANGEIVFPFYQSIVDNLIEPNAAAVGWLVMVGQMLVGLAILTGTFTNIALLLGLVMNVNFILSGRVNPSAFYIVIQTVLFVSMNGAILGIDARLSKRIPYGILVAQPDFEHNSRIIESRSFVAIAVVSGIVALYSLLHVTDLSPNAVDDPAMVLFVLASLGGLSAIITYLRLLYQGGQFRP